LVVAVGAATAARRAMAWHEKEHFAVTAGAASLLEKGEAPGFFRERGPATAGHCSLDPDVFKNSATPTLHHAEFPEHFFDLEYLADEELPRRRFEYLKLLHDKGLEPNRVGLLPYAIVEWTERLTMAFAEHRRWPQDEAIRAKCLVYAGHLAHYSGDLWQPLHTTIHYDGRVEKAGDGSPETGIHAKVDGLLRRIDLPADWARGIETRVYEDVWEAVEAELRSSHALVDRVYELESGLPALSEKRTDDEGATALGVELLRESARFTASLYRTAWAKSADVEFPGWFDRTKSGEVGERLGVVEGAGEAEAEAGGEAGGEANGEDRVGGEPGGAGP